MVICPETFYETNLKGKTAEQLMTTIRGLKQKIGRLRNIVEHPEYKSMMRPSEQTRISCYCDYLDRAKQALEEVGGTYVPSVAEKKAMVFNKNIPFINKIHFSIGGFLNGYETKTFTIDCDRIHTNIEHSFVLKPTNIGDTEIEEIDKEYFFRSLEELHIGAWRKHYNTHRFGYFVCDGTQWHLEIYFSNGYKSVKIYGDNAYPYNFSRLLELFEVEM